MSETQNIDDLAAHIKGLDPIAKLELAIGLLRERRGDIAQPIIRSVSDELELAIKLRKLDRMKSEHDAASEAP